MSLIEVMATTAFVAVALVGTGAAVLESSELTRVNTQSRAAAATLATLFEEVRGTPFDRVDSTFGNMRRTVTTIPDAPKGAVAVFQVTDVPTGSTRWQVRRVQVTLGWTGRSGATYMKAVSYVSDRATSGTPLFGSGSTAGTSGTWSSGTGDPVVSTTTTETTTTQTTTSTTSGGTQ